MLVKDLYRGKAFLDDMLSRMRRETAFILSLRIVLSLYFVASLH